MLDQWAPSRVGPGRGHVGVRAGSGRVDKGQVGSESGRGRVGVGIGIGVLNEE